MPTKKYSAVERHQYNFLFATSSDCEHAIETTAKLRSLVAAEIKQLTGVATRVSNGAILLLALDHYLKYKQGEAT
jgi:hypothetical protein